MLRIRKINFILPSLIPSSELFFSLSRSEGFVGFFFRSEFLNYMIFLLCREISKKVFAGQGHLAGSVDHGVLDLRVVSLSPPLGVEIT